MSTIESVKSSVVLGNVSWIKDVVAQCPDWRSGADALMESLASAGIPFSSGELAAALRTVDMNRFVFRVTSLGEHVRDRSYAGTMPQFPDGNGGFVHPVMTPRVTQGISGRTPAGVEVFVYAGDSQAGVNHDFEVLIPDPNVKTSLPTGAPPTLALPSPVAITGARAKPDVVATVHTDRRVKIPRAAFEAFVHRTGISLRGGDPVYVGLDGDKVIVSLSQVQGLTQYDLQATTGMLFAKVTLPNTLNPGAQYPITITSTTLVVDLSTPIN